MNYANILAKSGYGSFLPVMGWLMVAGTPHFTCEAAPPPGVDLSTYVIQNHYDLPIPVLTPNNRLALEASAVTYNWDTDTLFVLGDGASAVVQVSKTGQLIDSMLLEAGSAPGGTGFFDTEGITYVGGGSFVFVEERDRQVSLFTYVAGATLRRSDVLTVKLATTVGNTGLEGVSYDRPRGEFILMQEKDPESIFKTSIDFLSGPLPGWTDLFDPALASLADFSDVFALSNLRFLAGAPEESHLLVISQESGQIVQIDRAGTVHSRLTITAPPGNFLSVADMTMEGATMDEEGLLYVVNENGGGPGHPQLWVYAHSDAPNAAPTGLTFTHQLESIPDNTSLVKALKVANISVVDDGLGHNNLSLAGPDAGSFEIIGSALYLRAGTPLNSDTKPSYSVTAHVDDPSVGTTPDASAIFVLRVEPPLIGEASLIISEVAAWSSGTPLSADWFEVSNIGTAPQDITGWKVDDSSALFGAALELTGVTTIAPGESVIFIETPDASKIAGFVAVWFGGERPANLQIGTYSGSGIGLGTGAAGDAVNVYDTGGALQASVRFGASPAGPSLPTFDNAAGLNNATIGTLSVVGVNGAFAAPGDSNEIGSPGTIGAGDTPVVTITAIDANASEVGGDPGVVRITRSGAVVDSLAVTYTIGVGAGQANSADFTAPLSGSVTILPGQSFAELTLVPVDDSILEGTEILTLTLLDTGNYEVGLSESATISVQDKQPPQAQPGITVTRSGYYLDRRTGLFVQANTIFNTTAAAISGPIYLVLDNLSTGVSLDGAHGNTMNVAPFGSPYVIVLGPDESLPSGTSTVVTLRFANPARKSINYSTRVLSGGNVAP